MLGANKSHLLIGGDFTNKPYAEKSFTPSKNGRLKLVTFTGSSYSGAAVRLQDSDGNALFTFRMQMPTSIHVENVDSTFASLMTSGASHDLLSNGSGITQLTLDWNGRNVVWRVVNKNADNGNILYDTGFQDCRFGGTGIPSKLRLGTTTHNHTARVFGVTDLGIITIPVLHHDFTDDVASLKRQGWSFSGQNGAERISKTSKSDILGGNKNYLNIGGSFSSQPYAQKDFAAAKNGYMEVTTFTGNSYSNAAIRLQDSLGSNLFTLRMQTPTSIYVEDVTPAFTKNPMDSSATHDLLSSNGNSISTLSLNWDRTNASSSWRLINKNADTGIVVYDTGWQTTALGGTSDPSRVRFDTGTYNNAHRHFGITDLMISSNH